MSLPFSQASRWLSPARHTQVLISMQVRPWTQVGSTRSLEPLPASALLPSAPQHTPQPYSAPQDTPPSLSRGGTRPPPPSTRWNRWANPPQVCEVIQVKPTTLYQLSSPRLPHAAPPPTSPPAPTCRGALGRRGRPGGQRASWGTGK